MALRWRIYSRLVGRVFFFVPLCIKVYKKVQELETNKEKLHLAITNTTGTQNEDKTIVRTVGLH